MPDIQPSSALHHAQLLDVWEASVRATHDFLNAEQIQQIKQQIIEHQYFQHVQLFHVEQHGEIIGFVGLAEHKIEMLFVAPNMFRQGTGTQLLQHALSLGATTVDVNEQNPDATAFYLKQGFSMVSRSETDGEGNPFPILHLALSAKTPAA